MAVQGHPKSLISMPIKSADATLCFWLSATLVLSCSVSEIVQVFCWKQPPIPSYAKFRNVPHCFLGLDCRSWGSEELITDVHIITFEVTQPTVGLDRRTDRPISVATPRSALKVARGKNAICHCQQKTDVTWCGINMFGFHFPLIYSSLVQCRFVSQTLWFCGETNTDHSF